jgi:hypothetical protein
MYVFFIYKANTEAVSQALLYVKGLRYLQEDALHLLNSHFIFSSVSWNERLRCL